MDSIAHITKHTPLTENMITRSRMGQPISRPRMVYDNDEGFIMFDENEERAAEHQAAIAQDERTSQDRFHEALQSLFAEAKKSLPTETKRLDAAYLLVMAGKVSPAEAPGVFYVESETEGGLHYVVGRDCECQDFQKGKNRICKHRLATRLYTRAKEWMERETVSEQNPMDDRPAAGHFNTPLHSDLEAAIIQSHTHDIKGKKALAYTGLLLLARQRGLVSLRAEWIMNDAELSLATATATFQDGTQYTESGDASPANVTPLIRPHFRRMALTRAKARVLRDALGIDMVALEELGEA